MPDAFTSLEGPVELVNGKLTLTIPIEFGAGLVECSRGIGEVCDEDLVIILPDWLAGKLGIVEGTIVTVDNRDGKFNIRRNPVH